MRFKKRRNEMAAMEIKIKLDGETEKLISELVEELKRLNETQPKNAESLAKEIIKKLKMTRCTV